MFYTFMNSVTSNIVCVSARFFSINRDPFIPSILTKSHGNSLDLRGNDVKTRALVRIFK